jgi:hypothetical protein
MGGRREAQIKKELVKETEPINVLMLNVKDKDYYTLSEINDSQETFEDIVKRMNPKTLEAYLEKIINEEILAPVIKRAASISKSELERLLKERPSRVEVDEKTFEKIRAYVREEAEENLSSLSRVSKFLAKEVKV